MPSSSSPAQPPARSLPATSSRARSLRVGSWVEWKWGDSTASGRIVERFDRSVRRAIKGEQITRNGTPDDPAFLIEQDDRDRVLKLRSDAPHLTATAGVGAGFVWSAALRGTESPMPHETDPGRSTGADESGGESAEERDMREADTANGERADDTPSSADHPTGDAQARRNTENDPPA